MSFATKYSGVLTRLYRYAWFGSIASDTPSIPHGSLILAAHYNGAMDGIAYGSQLPGCLAVVSAQWRRSPFGRLLVPGISVRRAKDRGEGGNLGAFRSMIGALNAGERLLYFPEGTSRLGTERLPICRGTLLLLRQLRASGWDGRVYFAAAHYHEPTKWRSSVSLGWVGPSALPAVSDQDGAWVREGLLQAQAVAYAMPDTGPRRLILLAAAAALPYLPAWAAVSWLAGRIADEDNVIALWKFILGIPLTVLWLSGLTLLMLNLGLPWWPPLISLIGGWALWSR